MQILSAADYLQLTQDARILEQDGFGVKVLALTDGNILKLFRRKRLITSAALWPYAKRFATNATKLKQLGVPSPDILQLYKVPHIERDAVYYRPLPGLTLRQLQSSEHTAQVPDNLFVLLAEFVAKLHHSGVYFRSIHFGNIVLTPEQHLGLIDIADLKTQRRALSGHQRQRNFKHMLRDSGDRAWLASAKYGDFAQHYQDLTGHPVPRLGLN